MSDKDPELERSILDIADEANPYFFEWLKSTINLDVIRSLEINTFLLNYFISLNYFPAHELIDKIYAGKEYTEDQLDSLKLFRDYTERINCNSSISNCDSSISTFKTNNYKRFAKCEECGTSYALPKRGSISNSALICPRSKFPILIVEKKDQKAYFWTDQPCFSCIKFDKCETIKELISEFEELEVYGY